MKQKVELRSFDPRLSSNNSTISNLPKMRKPSSLNVQLLQFLRVHASSGARVGSRLKDMQKMQKENPNVRALLPRMWTARTLIFLIPVRLLELIQLCSDCFARARELTISILVVELLLYPAEHFRRQLLSENSWSSRSHLSLTHPLNHLRILLYLS
jgi:hypothetical protein